MSVTNPTPQEAAQMDPLELATILFCRNFQQRNTKDRYWKRLHRHYAKQALSELRQLTNRPPKRWQSVETTLGELHDGDLFAFPGEMGPRRARGNGWYDGPGGPYHRPSDTVVWKLK